MTSWRFWWCSALLLPALASADVEQRTLNDGNLVLEDIPEISTAIVVKLLQFQNVRSAGFSGWTNDGTGLYISTGFGDVVSLHHVTTPLGSRWQRTYFDEPMGQIVRRPGRSEMLITRDAGGSEFSQIFKLDPHTGNADMLTDGESRNGTTGPPAPGAPPYRVAVAPGVALPAPPAENPRPPAPGP